MAMESIGNLSNYRKMKELRARCAHWEIALCPPGPRCEGLYHAPHPDNEDGEPRIPLDCPHAGKPACPKHADMERVKQAIWMERCGVLKLYRHPEPHMVKEREKIDAYCDHMEENCEEGLGLLLTGGIGSGKTMALSYIVSRARLALPRSAIVVMAIAHQIFDWLCHDPARLQSLTRPDLLLIDDLGSKYRPDWGFSCFEGLVEQRYAMQRATCVSSSLSVAALDDAELLARVMSRWREVLTSVVLPEKDRRKPRTRGAGQI